MIEALFDFFASAIGGAAQWMFETLWALIDQTTLVDLGNPGYLATYNLVFGIAVVLTLVFFLAQLITGMIRRDPSALPRAALGAAKSILGSFLVITLATLLLEVTDQLTIGIVQAAGLTMSEMGLRLGALFAGLTLISLPAPGVGAIMTIFLGCLAIAGIAIVWFSLLVRKALILVAIVLAPIALSGAAWDTTRAWFGRWASFVLALIVSKMVVVLVLLVAVVQMDAPIDLDLQSIADPLAGIVLLLVAAFAPYLVYKLISFAGIDMYHAISTEQEAKQAMNRPLPVVSPPQPPKRESPAGDETPAPPSTAAGTEAAPVAGGGSPGGTGTAAGSAGSVAGGGGSAGGGTGAAGAGSVAAGPAAAVVIGAGLVVGAAEAGPRAGAAIGGAADGHADGAAEPSAAPAPANPGAPPPSTPPSAGAPATPPPSPPSGAVPARGEDGS